MIKDKKNIVIIILITIVIIILIVLVNRMLSEDKDEQKFIKLDNETKNHNYGSISNEQKTIGMNELTKIMENKTDKCKIIVNGDKITEKEIAFTDFQYNNSVISEDEKKVDATTQLIKEYLVEQDAKEKGVELNNEECRKIEEITKEQIKKEDKETNAILNAVNMDYNEFLEFYIKRRKRLEVRAKWRRYLYDAIKEEKLDIESKEYESKYK